MLPADRPDLRSLCALLGCSAASLLLLFRWVKTRRIQKRIDNARERRDRALGSMEEAAIRLSAEHPVPDPEEILSLSLAELSQKLKDGSLSPEVVLHCYMGKALAVTEQLNCVTDFLPECEAQLAELKQRESKDLLYGVPISLKDNFNCKGHDSTLGLINHLNRPACTDSVIVQILKRKGAVPFVKTNIPQSMLNYDCSNPIYGRTLNPLNHKKSPGGSSGGEGALIAAGGSILGVGSDIGGSIRFPSAFCGLCGFKPTGNRLSTVGVVSSSPGQKSGYLMFRMYMTIQMLSGTESPDITMTAMIGPIARDVDSLTLFMRAVLCEDMFNLDPTVPPLPFNEEVYSSSRPLRIGYYETDGFTMSTRSMSRAVLETKVLLEKAGHKLVPFTPPTVEKAVFEFAMKGLLADGGSTFLENFKGDIVDPNLTTQVSTYALPSCLKSLLSFIVKPVFPRLAKVLENTKETRSVKTLWKHHTAVEEYRQEFIATWKKLGLDAVLCPILGPALTVGYPGKLSSAVSYTILYNVVDFPVGVVPVTTVTQEDEEDLKNYGGHYKDFWDKLLKKAVSDGVGLPVAVQCVALPWQEEQCLRLMKEVETVTRRNLRG